MSVIPAGSFSFDPHGKEITKSYVTGSGSEANKMSDPATVFCF